MVFLFLVVIVVSYLDVFTIVDPHIHSVTLHLFIINYGSKIWHKLVNSRTPIKYEAIEEGHRNTRIGD